MEQGSANTNDSKILKSASENFMVDVDDIYAKEVGKMSTSFGVLYSLASQHPEFGTLIENSKNRKEGCDNLVLLLANLSDYHQSKNSA